jgi:hypothetical protein
MRLSVFTVAIVACLFTLVAAWSKEGKFFALIFLLVPDQITKSKRHRSGNLPSAR